MVGLAAAEANPVILPLIGVDQLYVVVAGTILPFVPLVGVTVKVTIAQVAIEVELIAGTGAIVTTNEKLALMPHNGDEG